MYGLISAQVAFCFIVLFAGSLFSATFENLAKRPTGFSADRVLLLDTVTEQAQPPVKWDQVADRLRAVAGVQSVALEAWPLLSGTMHNASISVNQAPASEVLAFFLAVSPGWLETMDIPLKAGRDLREGDSNVAVVNERFAKQYFYGANPVGKSFDVKALDGTNKHFEIAGLAGDASYRSLREEVLPQAYVPLRSVNAAGMPQRIRGAVIVVRTMAAAPTVLSGILRRTVALTDSAFRVSTVNTQVALIQRQTVRERLLANLGVFFAGVALLLAATGLYGVVNYSVMRREREIGIRIAMGAQARKIMWLVTARVCFVVLLGAMAGLLVALGSARYIEVLLYGVNASDPSQLMLPTAILLTSALLAVLPVVRRAVTIAPAVLLRAE